MIIGYKYKIVRLRAEDVEQIELETWEELEEYAKKLNKRIMNCKEGDHEIYWIEVDDLPLSEII